MEINRSIDTKTSPTFEQCLLTVSKTNFVKHTKTSFNNQAPETLVRVKKTLKRYVVSESRA